MFRECTRFPATPLRPHSPEHQIVASLDTLSGADQGEQTLNSSASRSACPSPARHWPHQRRYVSAKHSPPRHSRTGMPVEVYDPLLGGLRPDLAEVRRAGDARTRCRRCARGPEAWRLSPYNCAAPRRRGEGDEKHVQPAASTYKHHHLNHVSHHRSLGRTRILLSPQCRVVSLREYLKRCIKDGYGYICGPNEIHFTLRRRPPPALAPAFFAPASAYSPPLHSQRPLCLGPHLFRPP